MYKGGLPYGTMYIEDSFTMDLGLKKDFLNKKLTLSLYANDPFRFYKNEVNMYNNNKLIYSVNQNYYNQEFGIGLTWKFGSIKASRRSNERDDTQNRVN